MEQVDWSREDEKGCYRLVEKGTDEGPVWNLSQMTKYLARYMEQNQVVISGRLLVKDRFTQSFFMGYV